MSALRIHFCTAFIKVKRILLHDQMRVSRLGLIVGSTLWAFQLLLPVDIFPTVAQIAEGKGRHTYMLMATIAPENLWATLFLLHACCASYTLFSGVRDRYTLVFDGVLGCLLWTGSTIACYAAYWPRALPFADALLAYPPPAAMSGEAVMAFAAWWHMIRHWAEEPTAIRKRKQEV